MEIILFLSSACLGIWGYKTYWVDLQKDAIQPNRWSWLIWSITTSVEAFTYDTVAEGNLKSSIFFVSAVCCVIVTIGIWSKSTWQRPKWNEVVSILASMIAIILWIVFEQNRIAHFITVAALPIAFIPTWGDAWEDWKKEDSASWGLWTLGDIFAISVVIYDLKAMEELPFAIAEFTCHVAVWIIVKIKKTLA